MKFFAVLALAAVAFAEPEADAKADPAVLYGAYGYGLPSSVYAGYRTTLAYGAYPYSYGYYGKRSADAEPEAAADAEADPALLYGAYGYGLPYSGVYRSYGAYPYGYRTYGAYPYSYGYYGKRSADAEPEADAEADPALLYGAYGYGLPYSGVYRSYGAYPYGYRTYGAYPYAYYGKRSADAEPEADPALLYTTSNVVSPLTTAYTHVAAPLTTAYTHVAAPLTTAYTHVAAPLTTAYTHSVAAPVVKTVVPQVATYTVPAVATVGKAPAHGVAATYAGLVHSSHVGVCLNNVGVQVPC